MKRKSAQQNWRPVGEQLESRALLSTFTVTNADTYGPGSLAAAIVKADRNPGPDFINFQIPGGGVHNINVPVQGFPQIIGQVVINGYTQPGSAPNSSTNPYVNNAKIMVNLVWGGSSKALHEFLTVNSRGSGTQIRGLGFYQSGTNNLTGIVINRANSVTIDGNVFSATWPSTIGAAVSIHGGNHNTVGGNVSADPPLQNVMGGYQIGVDLNSGSTNTSVVGNLIGREPNDPSTQRIGVNLRVGANNNNVVKNILYKNIDPTVNKGIGNVISYNDVVPRQS